TELESLSASLLELNKTRAILTDARNMQCSPISQLPSELFVSIFQIIVDIAHPRNITESVGYINPAATLVRVCSRWRQVALRAGSLWSCIVISYENGERFESVSARAQMQLERTLGSPTDMFLSGGMFRPPNDVLDDVLVINLDVKRNPLYTCDLIKPYMKQLRSLTVKLQQHCRLETILECLLEHGTIGTLFRLEIFGGSSGPPLFHLSDSQTLKKLDKHLQSVRVLSLHAATFDWTCAVFQKLDELELDDLQAFKCPNVTQLAKILSASPSLRRLTLKKIMIHDGTGFAARSPVKLQYLGNLLLDRLDDAAIQRIFSVISLGQRGLRLSMNSRFTNTATLEAFRVFAREAKINMFRFASVRGRLPLGEILECLPDLNYLVLGKMRLDNSDFNALVHRSTMNITPPWSISSPPAQANPTSSPLSKITKLSLVMFKEAISGLSLKFLHMSQCSIGLEEGLQRDPSNTISPFVDATAELAIWLTRNTASRVMIE
ncbi:hypothetical protein BDV93DRAFT_516957, partial [Ceratobasidium sp. AG-I]